MQTVDNTKKKTKFFLLLICSAASQIISELFSEKLFRSQLCFFDDVDYTEAVDYTIPNPPPDNEIKQLLTVISIEGL